MSNSYFIALTLGMKRGDFSHPFLVYRPGRQVPDVRAGDQNATLRAGHRSASTIITIQILSVNSSMEFDLKNPKVIAAIICTLASFRLGLVWVVVSGVGSLVLLNYFM